MFKKLLQYSSLKQYILWFQDALIKGRGCSQINLCQKDLCICHLFVNWNWLVKFDNQFKLSKVVLYFTFCYCELKFCTKVLNKRGNVMKSDKAPYLSTLYFKMYELVGQSMMLYCSYIVIGTWNDLCGIWNFRHIVQPWVSSVVHIQCT